MSQPSTSKTPRIDLNDKVNKEDLLGTLIVVLLKARNLLDKHSFRKSDVFAQAILNGIEKRTHVDIKGGQHPEWDGEVRFSILKNSAAKNRKMELACYSVEPRSEDLMGKATLDISETLRTGEFDDWVQLEVDGVARGELYLEMTYYANAPAPTPASSPAAPNKMLSAVANQNTGLHRRPSKLSPSERLSRPQAHPNHGPAPGKPQPQLPQNIQQYPPQSSRISNTSNLTFTRPNDQSAHATHVRNSSAPTMPGAYPEGSESTPKQSHNDQTAQQTAPLPTILRPGQGSIPPPQNGFGHGRYPSESSVVSNSSQGSPTKPNPYLGASASGSQPSSPPHNPYISGSITPPNPYMSSPGPAYSNQPSTSVVSHGTISGQPVPVNPAVTSHMQSQNLYSGYRLSGNAPTGAPLLWQGSSNVSVPTNATFSFPQAGRDPIPYGYTHNDHFAHQRKESGGPAPLSLSVGYGQRPLPRTTSDAEPYLQTRYQTPLPLPPDASRSPTSLPSQHAYTAQPQSTHPPPPKTPTPAIEKTRLEALRQVEQEAARRREQELKDLELAMQLDREFNLQG